MSILPHRIIDRPVITEESQIQVTKANQYTFRVNPKANKHEIREAIEKAFPHVVVVAVNTMNVQGKHTGRMRVGRTGRKPDWKKAIVTLRDGDKIDLL